MQQKRERREERGESSRTELEAIEANPGGGRKSMIEQGRELASLNLLLSGDAAVSSKPYVPQRSEANTLSCIFYFSFFLNTKLPPNFLPLYTVSSLLLFTVEQLRACVQGFLSVVASRLKV